MVMCSNFREAASEGARTGVRTALQEPEPEPLLNFCLLGTSPHPQSCLERHLALGFLLPEASPKSSGIELFCSAFLWTSETNLILCALSRVWDPGFLRREEPDQCINTS